MYKGIYAYIYIFKYHLYNVTYPYVSKLTVWCWLTNWCALPEEDYFSHSWISLVDSSSLCRVEASRAFPQSTWACLFLLSFFSLCLRSHVGETLCIDASDITPRHNLTANALILWLTHSFHLLPCIVFEL